MNYYVQYHNVQYEGLLFSDPPFSGTRLAIHTRLRHVQEAEGQVFLIAGIGRPRNFFLWQTFEIEKVTRSSNGYFKASGAGWELAPPVELRGKSFDKFKSACASFVGFRCITDLPFTQTLVTLAEENRPPGDQAHSINFLRKLNRLFGEKDTQRALIRNALGHYQPVRALSIRQPHAEAIMRGIKKTENRSGPTRIRGRVFIYASQARYSTQDETELMYRYRIKDVSCDELPRGVLLGSIELFDCDDGEWHLREPQRANKLIRPTNQPQPVWFYPF